MSMNSLRAVSPLGSIKNAQSCTLSNRVCMFYPKDEFIAQRLLFHLMEVSFVSLPQIHLPKLLKAMVLYWSLWFQKEPLTPMEYFCSTKVHYCGKCSLKFFFYNFIAVITKMTIFGSLKNILVNRTEVCAKILRI